MKKTALQKIKKGATIFLVCTLIFGLLSGSFGVVMALSVKPATPTPDGNGGNGGNGGSGNGNGGGNNPPTYVNPVDPYQGAANTVGVLDSIRMLTETEAQKVATAVVDARIGESYWEGEYLEIVLDGAPQEFSPTLRSDGIVFIPAVANDPCGIGEHFVRVISCAGSGDRTYLRVQEPDPNEIFTSLDIATTQHLTADNLVGATFIPGVSAEFVGSDSPVLKAADAAVNTPPAPVEPELPEISEEEAEAAPPVENLALASNAVKAEPMGVGNPRTPAVEKADLQVGVENEELGVTFDFKEGDLVVNINIKFDDEEEDKKKEEDGFFETDTSFGIKGQFGVRDLDAHVVCEMPEVGKFEELYFGVSGEQFMNLHTYGKFEGKAEPKATEKDLFLLKLEGLNDKRFPIAVFQFQGTTPVYITTAQYQAQKTKIYPQLYLVLYADWEGSIELELTAGFDYARGFNNGLRVVKEGKVALTIENHPYPTAYGGEKESFVWDVALTLTAHTDLTIFGGSILFYIAGINVGEIGIARLGMEAEGKVTLTLSSDQEQEPVEGSLYLRGYLKLLEIRTKIAIKDTLWGSEDKEISFDFTLLEFELFRLGSQPEKYKPKMPISSMPLPDEFESAIMLVCDVSGSMNSNVGTGETKLEAAKKAAISIVDSTEGWAKNYEENYGLGLLIFSDNATPVAMPHVDYPFIKACVETISVGGGTCIYSGIDGAIAQLDTVNAKNKVIILMTDGQDYYASEAKASAQTAADKDITLYTIGFGNDVDSSLLEELANLGGGEYRYASTDNMLGILQSFMSAQQEANGEVLAETEGTVSQGETTEAETFTVEDQQGDLMVYTAWPGSFLDTILIDPNGRKVDEDYPNVIIDKSSIPTSIIVKNPIPGKWKTQIVGVETSYDEEPYFTIVSFMETESKPLNQPMNAKQIAAAYCMAIGFAVALFSLLLLIALGKKAKEQE